MVPLMPIWLNEDEYRTLAAACERLIPSDETAGRGRTPGYPTTSTGCSAPFVVDPPRIWAGGPSSGRFGGVAGFATFHRLTARSTNWPGGCGSRVRSGSPSASSTVRWSGGRSSTGRSGRLWAPISVTVSGDEQDARLRTARRVHRRFSTSTAAKGCTAPPNTVATADTVAWKAIDFLGDVQPRGYTDAEVSGP